MAISETLYYALCSWILIADQFKHRKKEKNTDPPDVREKKRKSVLKASGFLFLLVVLTIFGFIFRFKYFEEAIGPRCYQFFQVIWKIISKFLPVLIL